MFSGQAERKCPLTRCSQAGKQRILGEVGRLRGSGTTNLAFGFVCGLEVLKQRRVKNTVTTMMLFSDGESNEGLDALSTSLQVLQSSGIQPEISIHTFGFGPEIKTNVLSSLSNIGRGIFQSISDSQSTKAAFSYIFGSVTSLAVKDVTVTIHANDIPVKVDVAKKYTKDGADSFTITEIDVGDRKDLLFTLHPQYQLLMTQESFPPVTVEVRYKVGNTEMNRSAPLVVRFVPWEWGTGTENREVFQNWCRVRGADALREAKERANNKDFAGAVKRLSNASEDIGSSGYESIPMVASVLHDLLTFTEYVRSDTTWTNDCGDVKFASICYSHYNQTPSPDAPQYASGRQAKVASQLAGGKLSVVQEESV